MTPGRNPCDRHDQCAVGCARAESCPRVAVNVSIPAAGNDSACRPANRPSSTQTSSAIPTLARSESCEGANRATHLHHHKTPQEESSTALRQHLCNCPDGSWFDCVDARCRQHLELTPTTGTVKPCAPVKVIVRQGGTSEPSIQLAGGTSADQTSHKRDVVNQILGSADANLKKIAGRQLSSSQQDMVNQIRQFMSQSKAAIDVGDLERARTLAWKAQLCPKTWSSLKNEASSQRRGRKGLRELKALRTLRSLWLRISPLPERATAHFTSLLPARC